MRHIHWPEADALWNPLNAPDQACSDKPKDRKADANAALRRLDEVDTMLEAIKDNPASGVRLGGALDGWLVRHGGAGHRLTILFRPDVAAGRIYLALAAFGGKDWMTLAPTRNTFSE